MRRLLAVVGVALLLGAGTSGCKSTTSAGTPVGSGAASPTAGGSPSAVATTAPPLSPVPSASSKKPVVPGLTCAQLKGAQLGSTTLSYNGYHDSIPLGDGHWSGEDGAEVDVQPQCAAGDLTGDGAADLLGVVSLRTGGTGTFYTLVVWKDVAGEPVCQALYDLGDRDPVVSISIALHRATVVWLTRTADAPLAAVNLKRTSVLQLSGQTMIELTHADVPYTP